MSKPIELSSRTPAAASGSRALRRIFPGLVALIVLIAYPFAAAIAIERGASILACVPPIAVNLALAALFANTLRTGREPMIARFARAERGALEPDLASYTRKLTIVWAVFFIAVAAVDVALAFGGSRVAWLAFTGLGSYLLVAALFVGEWVFRRWRFRHYRHASPLALTRHVLAVLRQDR